MTDASASAFSNNLCTNCSVTKPNMKATVIAEVAVAVSDLLKGGATFERSGISSWKKTDRRHPPLG